MKDTYYFRHDYNSRNDLKIQALLDDFGALGYGIFWAVTEILHEEETHSLPLSAITYKAIGKQMSTSVEQVEAVVNGCFTYGLLIKNGTSFYSERVNENIELRVEISALRSKAGKESAKKRAIQTNVEQVPTSVEHNPTKKRKEKEIKGKDRIAEESKEKNILFQSMIEIYNTWFYEMFELPPEINGREGKAVNSIIAYIKKIQKSHDKDSSDQAVVDAWNYTLQNYGRWEAFHQKQTKISQISSNLQNILKTLKHGQKPNVTDSQLNAIVEGVGLAKNS